MSIQLQLRRGSTSDHAIFAGADGEVTVDLTKKVLVSHDGTTIGGFPMQRELAILSNGSSIISQPSSLNFVGCTVNAAGNIVTVTIPTPTEANNAATANALTNARVIALAGDASGSTSFDGSSNVSITTTLATINTNVGTFGSSNSVATLTVNAKGLVTSVSNSAIAFPVSSVFGRTGAVTLESSDVTGALGFTPLSNTLVGVSNGLATLDGSGKLTSSQLPSSVVGALVYQGTWDAFLNSPSLSSSAGTKGQYYKVSNAGTTSLNGISSWNLNDTVVYDGTTWDKIDGITNEVISVAGKTGVVTLAVADVSGAAPLASPALTGTPTAPTAATSDSSNTIATTAFIKAQNYLAGNQTITATGDATGTGTNTIALTLANVNTNIGSFGSNASAVNITVNAKGLITAVSTSPIIYPVTSVFGRTGAVTLTSSDVTTALSYTPISPTYILTTPTGDANYGGTYGTYNPANGILSVPVILNTSGVTAGTYGTATQVATLAINAKGIVTGALNTNITFPVSSVFGRTGAVTLASSDVTTALGYTPQGAIVATGDVSGTATQNAISLTLASVGTAGTYSSVVTDSKGRVISGSTTPNQTITVSGDASGNGTNAITLTLANVNSNVGVFGTTTVVPSITVNAKGLITAVSNSAIAFPVTSVFGRTGNVVILSADVTGALGYTPVNNTVVGVANGIATLNSSGQLTAAQLPASIVGAVVYQGTWDAFINSPTLTSSSGTKGFYYKVSNAGTTTLNGLSSWNLGDTAIYDGTTWDKIDGIASEVLSVAGRTGVVTLAVADVTGAAATVSPTFTGTIIANAATFSGLVAYNGQTTAVTVANTDNTANVATTAFVKNQGYVTSSGAGVPSTGGTFTGTVNFALVPNITASLPSKDSTSNVATTAFVNTAITGGSYTPTFTGIISTSGAVTSNNGPGIFIANAAGNSRWSIKAFGTESGSNSGADLQIQNYPDTGVALGVALKITRATGLVTLANLATTTGTFTSTLGVAGVTTLAGFTATTGTFSGLVAFNAQTTAITVANSDNTTNVATTAWVKSQGYSTSGGSSTNTPIVVSGDATGTEAISSFTSSFQTGGVGLTQNLYTIAYGNGVYAATWLSSNACATSTDGINWTPNGGIPSGFNNTQLMLYGNGLFFLANSGGNVTATSSNGVTWTTQTLPSSTSWSSGAYGNGTYILVSKTTAVATSTNGSTWTAQTGQSGSWVSTAYGNNTFVSVAGSNTTTAAQYSTNNGVTWTLATTPQIGAWKSIAYGNNIFVAVSGASTAMYSTNGITWTGVTTLPVETGGYTVSFGGGVFFATTAGSPANGLASVDGINWYTLTFANDVYQTVYGANQFVTISGTQSQYGTITPVANASGALTLTLATTGVAAGTYGNSIVTPVVTIDTKGRVTNITTVSSGFGITSIAAVLAYYVSNWSSSNYLSFTGLGSIGTGNYTWECWMNLSTVSGGGRIAFYAGGSGCIAVTISGGTVICNEVTLSLTGITAGVWFHVAFVRNGSTLTGYLNGTSGATATPSTNCNLTAYTIGTGAGFPISSTDKMSNLRVTNTAQYTSNFTVPSGSLTNVSGTQLLTLQDSTAIDHSNNSYAITTNGSPTFTVVSGTGFTPASTNAVYLNTDYVTTNIASPAISAGAVTIDLTAGELYSINLTATTSVSTVNNPPSGVVRKWYIVFTGTGTAATVTWSSAFKWAAGSAPTVTTTSGKRDMFQFITYDGGTTILSRIVGQNY